MLGSDSKVRVRAAGRSDAVAISSVAASSWQLAYTGIIAPDRLRSVLAHRGPDYWRRVLRSRDRLLVLEVMGDVAGYASYGLARPGGSEEGEIYEIYLAPVYQGLGFGEFLFEGCRARLDRRGHKGLIVGVLRDNHHARSFYERRGGRLSGAGIDRSTGEPLRKVYYTWE